MRRGVRKGIAIAWSSVVLPPSLQGQAPGQNEAVIPVLLLTPHWTVSAYGSVAPSGPVVQASSPSSSAGRFAFLEVEYRR